MVWVACDKAFPVNNNFYLDCIHHTRHVGLVNSYYDSKNIYCAKISVQRNMLCCKYSQMF